MSRRLRVGVPAGQGDLGASTGHGRAWQRLLAGLRDHVEIVEVTSGRRGRRHAAVDVWLVDGHVAPPAVREPMVSIVHDVRWADPALQPTLPVAFLAVIVPETELAVRASTRVVTPSAFSREQVVTAYGFDPARVDVVPYGVDLDVFRPGLPGGRAIVARAAGAQGVGERPYVLFVGAAEPRKNLDALRSAMAMLAGSHEHVLALRVGPAPGADSRSLLAAAVAELPGVPGRVVALPPLGEADLAAVVAGADVLCLPSLVEGFGFPALEAMAAGTPVVVAARGSLPELVGDAGVLVEPDADAIAAGLRAVLDDPSRAADLAACGRARANELTWAASARALAGALERAADDRARALPPVSRRLPEWVDAVAVTSCPACGAPVAGAAHVGGPRAGLRECARCEATFAGVRLAPGVVDPDDDARTMDPEWFGIAVSTADLDAQRDRSARARIALLREYGYPRGRLLDVQAGRGATVRAATDAGWEASGTRLLGDALRDDGPPLDVVVVSHALAREADALGVLRALRAGVRPGGLLLIETPNWASAVRRRDLEGWHFLRPLEHVVHFTPATLRATLTRAGWEPVTVVTRTWLGGDLVTATHALVPLRRVLRRALDDGDGEGAVRPSGRRLVEGLTHTYDAAGLGDVVVAVARRPLTAGDETGAPPTCDVAAPPSGGAGS